MSSKIFALLIVGPDVVGGSQRCEVEIFRTSTLEHLAKELESQIQFFSTNCLISLIEIFDYNKGQYVPLQDLHRQLEDRARLRVRCARNVPQNNNNSSEDNYKTQQYYPSSSSNSYQQQQRDQRKVFVNSNASAADRELDAKAEAIRQRASSPEAFQRFKNTTPDHGGPVGRATMLGKPLPVSSILPTSLIDGGTPRGGAGNNNNNHNNKSVHFTSAQSQASSRHSNASTSLDQARRVGTSMSYLNGPTNRPSVYNDYYSSAASDDENNNNNRVSSNFSPQREYQKSLIQNYQKQQTQNYQQAEEERQRTMRGDTPNNSNQNLDRFLQAATRSMNSHQPQFSPPKQQQQQAQSSTNNNLPETITIFCVYNGPDGQRAKAISVSRKRPDLNQVLTTLESKFQLPLCLGYIDPDSGDCEEVRSQQQFAQILNDRNHMHDPNAGCTFQCWMRVEDHAAMKAASAAAVTPDQKFENSRKTVNVCDDATMVSEIPNKKHTSSYYYSPENKLHRSTPGRHNDDDEVDDNDDNAEEGGRDLVVSPMSSERRKRTQEQQIREDPPHYSPNNNNNNANQKSSVVIDLHRHNRHATISPVPKQQQHFRQGENTATKISQYALQRLQALEAEQARRDNGGTTPRPASAMSGRRNNNNGGGGGGGGAGGSTARSNRPQQRPIDTRSMISVVSAAPSTVLVTEDQLQDTFDELDLEGTGFVTKAAMRNWFDKNVDTMGVPGSDKKFEKMLATAKRRHELDYQEFCVVMLKIAQW